MKIYIECNEEDKVLHVGTSPIGVNPIEVEVESMDIFNSPSAYKYENGQLVKDDSFLLDKMREDKLNSLTADCNKTIIGRFSHIINGKTYFFSNDMEAQSNFEKADRAFEKGRFTEVSWTCYNEDGDVCRLVFTAETFEELYVKHLEHIQYNVSKFRDVLMPQVDNAETIEELESIVW